MNNNLIDTNAFKGYEPSYAKQLGLLSIVFLSTLFVMAFVNYIIGVNTAPELLINASLQDVIVFCGSAFVVAYYSSRTPFEFLGLNKAPRTVNVVGVLIAYIFGIFFLNQIIYWNEHLSLPEGMKVVESTFRSMEDQAAKTTEIMLSGTSAVSLVVNILIVGVLTGISEELFFRGALQKVLERGMGPVWAIWIAALIFSLLHFQFFGFVPRLLLGAFFGYLYFWTGSIWVSAIAHAINNSIVVVTTWMVQRGDLPADIESLFIDTQGIPWLAIISFAAVYILLSQQNYLFFLPKKSDEEEEDEEGENEETEEEEDNG